MRLASAGDGLVCGEGDILGATFFMTGDDGTEDEGLEDVRNDVPDSILAGAL